MISALDTPFCYLFLVLFDLIYISMLDKTEIKEKLQIRYYSYHTLWRHYFKLNLGSQNSYGKDI